METQSRECSKYMHMRNDAADTTRHPCGTHPCVLSVECTTNSNKEHPVSQKHGVPTYTNVINALFYTVYFPFLIIEHLWILYEQLNKRKSNHLSNIILTDSGKEFDFMKMWTMRDTSESDIEEYRKILIPLFSKECQDCDGCKRVLKREIQEVCKHNFVKRFRVICQLLRQFDFAIFIAVIRDSHDCIEILVTHLGCNVTNVEFGNGFEGVTILHLAVARKNENLLQMLITTMPKQCLLNELNTRANGEIFLSLFPHGENIFHLAVYLGNISIVKLIYPFIVDIGYTDKNGNNVFHIMALSQYENPEIGRSMFELLTGQVRLATDSDTSSGRHYQNSNSIFKFRLWLFAGNYDGYTPLKLACKRGRTELVESILDTNDVYFFPLKHIGKHTRARCYNVSELDPALPDAENTGSCLELLVMSDNEKATDCLQISPILKIINIKWEHTRPFVICRAICHLIILILLIFIGLGDMQMLLSMDTCSKNTTVHCTPPATNNLKLVLENIFVGFVSTGSAAIMCFEGFRILSVMRKRTLLSFRTIINMIVSRRYLNVIFCASFFVYFIMKICGWSSRMIALSMALFTGWLIQISILRAFKVFSFFSVMFRKILSSHIFQFSIMLVLLLVSFATSSRMLYSDTPTEFQSLSVAVISFIKLAVGINEFKVLLHSDYSWLSTMYFVGFVTLANNLLFNMLIATMTETYEHCSRIQDDLCLYQRAHELVILEWISPMWLNRFLLKAVQKKFVLLQLPDGSFKKKFVYLLDTSNMSNET